MSAPAARAAAAPTGVKVDAARLREVERLAAYELANGLLLMNLDLQRRFGLRAEQYQVFMIIVIATVQRFARTATPQSSHVTRTPLPPDLASAISRRRIADVLGIPVETVRRHVSGLLGRGLIVERGRGRLSTPGGTLERISADETPERIATRYAAVASALERLGVFRLGGRE